MVMRSPVRLVRNTDAGRLFDTFLVSSIATVLLTRLYLSLTGFPQIGGESNLHIAHMLPGGLLMLTAILIMLGAVNRSSRDVSAFLGGIGFGLFWDELGKFITKDNDYFFRPTAGLIYLSFVGLYLLTRYVIRRSYHPQDYLANAIDLAMEGAIGELDPREYQRAQQLLAKADRSHPMYQATVQLLDHAKPTQAYTPFFVDRAVALIHKPFRRLVQRREFARALLTLFYIYGLALLCTLGILLFEGTSHPIAQLLANPTARSNSIAATSSIISSIYIIWGAWLLQHRHTLGALRRFETALLINIFITQVFLFFSYQFAATVALVVALFLLFSVRILLTETKSNNSKV
ncbi:MAG TPA: hypothetical protein VMY99_04945 [Nevskiaceae bacterium]|nr:hypothetical protein [Nevskiaceae bacterium]